MQYFGGKSGLTQPSAWYISLHTGDPGDTAGSSEVSTGGGTLYARQQILNIGNAGAGRWVDVTAANPNVMTNNATITFPTSGASWGTITWFGVWDASTAGNYLGRGQLASSVVVGGAGITVSFAASALQLTIAPT